jgi:hypothetical protein
LSIVVMFVFFIEGARMGQRDRVYPMALWMTALCWPPPKPVAEVQQI